MKGKIKGMKLGIAPEVLIYLNFTSEHYRVSQKTPVNV